MTSEYKYYKRNGKLMRLHIEQDEEPLDPRYDWDGNIGKMMCWHRDYRLGDYKENKFADNEDFLNDLVRENVKDTTVINYVKIKRHQMVLNYGMTDMKKCGNYGELIIGSQLEVPRMQNLESLKNTKT